MKYVFAHTPVAKIGATEYVEFINISEKLDGSFRVMVRQRSEHPAPMAFLDMPREEVQAMVDALTKYLNV